MTLCSDPTTKVAQLFDPKIIQVSTETSQWYIDFSLDGIDIEGWTYARNMTYLNKHIVGTAKDRWNCNVRRRKWKFRANQDSKDVISCVRDRNKDKMIRRAAAGGVIDCAARESNQESKAISDYFSAISEQLNEESQRSRSKLEQIEDNMRRASEKQAVVH